MYYLLISISACLFSMQFMATSAYSKNCGNSWQASMRFSFYSALTGLVLLLIINRFHFHFTQFSLIMACVYSIICLLCSYCSIQAYRLGNLSVYSVFCMIGGMLLPAVYGMAFGEEISVLKILCLLALTFAVYIASPKGKASGKGFIYYIGVFIFNGSSGVILNIHQSQLHLATDSASFMMLSFMVTLVITSAILMINNKKNLALPKQGLAFCSISSLLNTTANFILMLSLLHLPASVQFPFITGGTIVFSTIFSFFRKENVQKREIFGSSLALFATVFMFLISR